MEFFISTCLEWVIMCLSPIFSLSLSLKCRDSRYFLRSKFSISCWNEQLRNTKYYQKRKSLIPLRNRIRRVLMKSSISLNDLQTVA